MPVDVIMPKVDMVMDEGTVVRWHKSEGDAIKAGDLLFDIATNKAEMEVEAPASGILARITAPEGTTVPVATVIALILQKGERLDQLAAPTAQSPAAQPTTAAPMATIPEPALLTLAATKTDPRPRATPLARRMAREHTLDLAALTGSGSQGRIRKDDVFQAITARRSVEPAAENGKQQDRSMITPDDRRFDPPVVAPLPTQAPEPIKQPLAPPTPSTSDAGKLVPLVGVRKVIAQRMTVSATIPQFTLSMDVELSAAMQLRQRLPYRPSITAIIARVVASLLPRHPTLNASFREDGIWLHTPVHLGIALDSGGDLLVPVIRDAHQRSLSAIMTALTDMRKRAEAKQFTPSELQGSTFTLSNLGMLGIDHFTALVNPPEAAILAAGRSTQRLVEENGTLVWKPMLTLTLSADHRVTDGATAARFLGDVRAALEEPLLLI